MSNQDQELITKALPPAYDFSAEVTSKDAEGKDIQHMDTLENSINNDPNSEKSKHPFNDALSAGASHSSSLSNINENTNQTVVGEEQIPVTTSRFRRWSPFPSPPDTDLGPPPDGGCQAWMQVAVGNLVNIVTWGLITSFGVFQTDYQGILDTSPSAISWIGTVQTFLVMLFGAGIGRASDAGLAREAVFLGSILIVFGLLMLSLSTEYYQVFLSQGFCVGIGMGLIFVPGLSVLSAWFTTKKPFAVGIAGSGIGVGGLIYPTIMKTLLPRIGFPWTIRCVALVTLFICLILVSFMRVRVPARRSGSLVEAHAFKEPSYLLFTIGFFLLYWAIYFIFFYIDAYGHAFAAFSDIDAIDLLLITNGLGIPGRIIPGYIASCWLGPLNTTVPLAIVTAIIVYCWAAVGQSSTSLYVYAAIYGFVGSALQGCFAISLASLTLDTKKLGTRIGMVFSIVAFATLTGSPIGGAIVEARGGSYLGAQIWAGTSLLLGGIIIAGARIARTGYKLKIVI